MALLSKASRLSSRLILTISLLLPAAALAQMLRGTVPCRALRRNRGNRSRGANTERHCQSGFSRERSFQHRAR